MRRRLSVEVNDTDKCTQEKEEALQPHAAKWTRWPGRVRCVSNTSLTKVIEIAASDGLCLTQAEFSNVEDASGTIRTICASYRVSSGSSHRSRETTANHPLRFD